eukprot:gene18379-16384_t
MTWRPVRPLRRGADAPLRWDSGSGGHRHRLARVELAWRPARGGAAGWTTIATVEDAGAYRAQRARGHTPPAA